MGLHKTYHHVVSTGAFFSGLRVCVGCGRSRKAVKDFPEILALYMFFGEAAVYMI